jgi:hypothetical protein
MASTISVSTVYDPRNTVGTTATAGVSPYIAPTPSYANNALSNSQAKTAVGSISIGAGTASTATLTILELMGNPILTLDKTGQNATNVLTLPHPSTCAGVNFKIIQKSIAVATAIVQINCTGGQLFRGFIRNGTEATYVAGGLRTTLSFLAASAMGDNFWFHSDGTNWYFQGESAIASGLLAA